MTEQERMTHPDDEAVDRFAAAMKAKLAKKRADGRAGWEGPSCSQAFLSELLVEHVAKGDPVDVGNIAMMLHQRGEAINALTTPTPQRCAECDCENGGDECTWIAPAQDGDRACQLCGIANPTWFAPNDVWNRVVGGPDARDDPGGILCPCCFMAKGDDGQVVWVVKPESRAFTPTPQEAAKVLLHDMDAIGNYPHDPQSQVPWGDVWRAMRIDMKECGWTDWPSIMDAALRAISEDSHE